jgi:ubiquinone/menaquinone biosynthesis C-methylase UbiE
VSYDARRAAAYWSSERHAAGDELASVLSLGEPPAVNRAYDAWETGLLLAALPSADPRRALDLGAGVGRVSERLARRVPWIACADLAPGMLERLRRRLEDAGVPLTAYDRVRHGAERVPYRDASFDLVACLGLLEHLPASLRERALEEAARVLRPGGWLAIVLNNAESRFLGDPRDNPHRRGEQRENGYFCDVVDAGTLRREAERWFAATPLGSNLFYSLHRHAARSLPADARSSPRLEPFFASAARWDVALRPLEGMARVAADHHLHLWRRR